MIHIIGESLIPQSRTFNDVRNVLEFDKDVYLGAMWSKWIDKKLENVAIYNMESLHEDNPLWEITDYMDTLRNNHVIDFSLTNVEILKQKGIDSFYMPYGYHLSQERFIPKEKDIDVLFIGTGKIPRRERLFSKLNEKCNFVCAYDFYGDELDNLIGRSKVHLNLHRFDFPTPLEVVRINYLMSNHCNVVSEYGDDQELNEKYEPGLHFSDYGNLVDTCLYALSNPKDGYETIKKLLHDCKSANDWLNEK
jgi:hypothetical protein